MQVSQLVAQRYPGMEVIGSAYPVPPFQATMAKLVQVIQLSFIAFIFAAPNIFQSLGMPLPTWYTGSIATNKFGYAMGAWFLGNFLNQQLIATGAFEIFFDGHLVFSKLVNGRLPTAAEFWEGLQQAVEASGGFSSAAAAAAAAAAY
mmetsp:Transcript_28706/g.63222  ORF Transcript_28706/g.63222 Transcript_28706/m.63222 type:complete len:147 (+) Transcript_28706:247-687(+)